MPDPSAAALSLAILLLAGAHASATVAAALRAHIGVVRVVGMPLRAVRLLSSRVNRPVAGSVTGRCNGLKMSRITTPAVRAGIATCAFFRIMASVIQNLTRRDRPVGELVGDSVCFTGAATHIECPVSLSQSTVPGPAFVRFTSINERRVAVERSARCRAAAASMWRSMTTQAQVMRVTQTDFLDVQRAAAPIDVAYRTRHV
jgi:hypothetical protein